MRKKYWMVGDGQVDEHQRDLDAVLVYVEIGNVDLAVLVSWRCPVPYCDRQRPRGRRNQLRKKKNKQ